MRAAVVAALVALAPALAAAGPYDFRLPSGDLVPGTRLDEMGGFEKQVERVRAATSAALGVEIGGTPTHLVTMEEMRALHTELGGQLPHGFTLYGFELRGHVFVRSTFGGVPDDVLIHECLHAQSERFSGQAGASGAHKMVEGITQYLTLQALGARPADARRRATKNRIYMASTDFADALATLVGEAQLRGAYLGAGLPPLAARVDAQTHAHHVLVRAARRLEGGDERGALQILTSGR